MAGFKNGLKKVGQYWHYKFKFEGEQRHGSTRCTNREDAQVFLHELLGEVRKRRIRRGDIPTFRAVWARYKNDNTKASEQSKKTMGHTIEEWVLPIIGDVKVSEIGPQHLGDLKRHYLANTKNYGHPHSQGGLAKLLADVRTVVNWTKQYPEFRGVEVPKVQIPSVQEKVITVIPAFLFEAFLAIVGAGKGSKQVALAVRVMLYVGLRISEVTSMKWAWFSSDFMTYTPGLTKGREADPLPVKAGLAPFLQAWKEEATAYWTLQGLPLPPVVFFVQRTRRGWRKNHANPERKEYWDMHTTSFCNSRLEIAAKKLGLECPFGPHRLRHSFATALAERGVSLKVIQKLLRHKSPITTERYIHLSQAPQRDAVERLPSAAGPQIQVEAPGPSVSELRDAIDSGFSTNGSPSEQSTGPLAEVEQC